MLNKMKQDGQARMQQAFNDIMQRSIQKSGAQVDPNDIPNSLGGIIAQAMIATLSEAQANNKKVQPTIVIQSAIDVAQQVLQQFDLSAEEEEALMSQIFSVAMDSFLATAQDAISQEDRAKYEQFMQMLNQGMQQQPQQQQEAQPAQQGGM
ncbi:hypothetical protein ACPV5U_08505 [Vibrio mediterranei]